MIYFDLHPQLIFQDILSAQATFEKKHKKPPPKPPKFGSSSCLQIFTPYFLQVLGRHAACLVWNWMAWGGHQLWVPSASSISFRFANQDMFVSFPILGNARGNADFQAPSNACSPICGSDPYGYNISLVTCIDIQL